MSGGPVTEDARRILRARAQALGRSPDQPDTAGASIEVLEFRLGRERYAVESRCVREVYPLRNFARLPSAPPFVPGIVNVRGRIVAVLDLRILLGLPETGMTDLHRIILIGGRGLEFGLLADADIGMTAIADHDLQGAHSNGIGGPYVKGVTAERLIVLDMDRLLADPKIIVNEEVEG